MASKTYKAAKKSRDKAKKSRATAVKKMKAAKPNTAAWKKAKKDVIKKSSAVRKQGNIMRAETGRDMGERTKYTGALKKDTLDMIREMEKEAPSLTKLPKDRTDWQKANISLLNSLEGTYGEKRRKWDQMWADDRAGMIKKQKNELTRLKNAGLLDDIELDEELQTDVDRVSRTPAKITGGSEYLATDYDRPAFQDWSDLAPPDMPGLLGSAKAQQDLLGSGMAAYQPWAQPAIEYQPPVGPTYATRASLLGGAVPSVSGAGDDVITSKDNGKTYGPGGTYDNYQDWYMAPENPAGHYWALANAARADNKVSPWGNEMDGGIWKYKGGGSTIGSTNAIVGRDLGEDARLLDLVGNKATPQLLAYNTVNPLQRSALSNVSYRAPLAAPTASAAAPTFASVPIGGWQGRTNISNDPAQLNALNAMENIARNNAGILAGGAAPYGDYGAYATPQSILAMQGTST